MRIIPDFPIDKESPLVSVWVSLNGLPFHMFHRDLLGILLAGFLAMEGPIASLTRPSVARICVEIDITYPLMKCI